MSGNDHPLVFADLVDYVLGELPETVVDALEEHLFGCPECAAELEALDRLGVAVRAAVRAGSVGANVTGAFLEHAAADGMTLRQYRLVSGQTVACSAGSEDLVVVRLAADFGPAQGLSLRVDYQDLDSGESHPLAAREVDVDLDLGEVVLVFPGTAVRAFPRSRWSLTIEAETGRQPVTYGPFVMDHTP